jgi:hypothetical protein
MLPQLPQDKANHFVYGLVIFIAVGFAFGAVAGLVAAIVAGGAKEIYDLVSGKGHSEGADFLATALGGVFGFLCSLVA